MEYWVAMNETELKTSLLLLEKMELTGVISIEPDFKPEEKSLAEMLEKYFFEQTNDGVSWNPFVKMVLWIAANAQSELSIQGGTYMSCRLYFYDETMILMTRDMEEDLFIFYYVPLLPKAIGGIAKYLEESGVPMLLNSSGKHQRITLPPNPADDSLPLKDLLMHSAPTLISNNLLSVTIDGALGRIRWKMYCLKHRMNSGLLARMGEPFILTLLISLISYRVYLVGL